MKRILILLLSLLLQQGFSQMKMCGTVDKEINKWERELIAMGSPHINTTNFKPRATIYIPIHYHIVTQDNGFGGYPLNYLFFIHCDMNAEFKKNKIDVQFYLDTISYIKSTKFYDITKPEDDDVTATYNTLKHCNVYLVNNPNGACGYVTDFPDMNGTPETRSSIFMQASANNFDCSNPGNKTLPHEMGHWLDLRHTFSGWEGYSYFGSQSPQNTWENVPRSGSNANCSTHGDKFCDTDPDYIANRWDCATTSNTLYTDALGNSFKHSGTNFMSYSNDACSDSFSQGQNAVMTAALSNFPDRIDLLSIVHPNLGEIGATAYFSPVQNIAATGKYLSNNFQLKWASQPNTYKYLVTLAKGNATYNSNFEFLPTLLNLDSFTSDTFINIPTEFFGFNTNNNYYYWKVHAYNRVSACEDNVIATQAFRVGYLDISYNVTQPKCNGQQTGKIDIVDQSGFTGLQFYFNSATSTTDKSFSNLAPGVYKIDVKYQGTTFSQDVIVNNPTHLNIDVTFNSTNSVTINGKNGTAPYTYSWSNGSSNPTQNDLPFGDYYVTVTDSNGCTTEGILVKISNGAASIHSSNQTNEFKLFPTKLNNGSKVKIQSKSQTAKVQVEIFDISGKVVRSHNLKPTKNEFDFIWDIKNHGMYFIQLTTDRVKEIIKVEAH